MAEMEDPLGLRERLESFQKRIGNTMEALEGLAAGLENARALPAIEHRYRSLLESEGAAAREREEQWTRMRETVRDAADKVDRQAAAVTALEQAVGELREKHDDLSKRHRDDMLGLEQRLDARRNDLEGRLTARLESRAAAILEAVDVAKKDLRARDEALESSIGALRALLATTADALRRADDDLRNEGETRATEVARSMEELREELAQVVARASRP